MLRFLVRTIANLVVNHNKLLIGIFIILIPIAAILMDLVIGNLKSDYLELMPEDNQTVENIRHLEKVLGGLGTVFVVSDDDPSDPKIVNEQDLEAFTKRLGEKLNELKQSEYLRICTLASEKALEKSTSVAEYHKNYSIEYDKLTKNIKLDNAESLFVFFKPTATYVDYKLDSYIKDHLLYLLDTKDLEDLVITIRQIEQEMASDEEKKRILKDKIEEIMKKYQGEDSVENTAQNDKGYYISSPYAKNKEIVDELISIGAPKKIANALFGHNEQISMILVKPSHMPSNTVKTVKLREEMDALVNDIQKEIKGDKIRVRYSGGYFLTLEQQEYMLADIGLTFKLAIGGITLVLLIYFSLGAIPKTNRNYFLEIISTLFSRSFFVIFIMVSIIVANIFTFAYAYIVYGYVNIVSGFLRALLTGIGVEFGIQFMSRFKEELRLGHDKKTAIHTAIKETGFASFTSLMTMAIAFFVLGLSEFKGFSEFGIIAGAGVIFDNLVMYLLVGSLMLAFAGKKVIGRIRGDMNISSNMYEEKFKKLQEAKFPYPKTILTIVLIITAGLGYYGISNIEFEYNSRNLQVQTQQSLMVDKEVEDKFNFSTDPEIIITDNYDDHYQVTNHFRGEAKKVLPKFTEIREVLGFCDLVPTAKQVRENNSLIDILRDRVNAGLQYGIKKDMTDEEKEQFSWIQKMTEASKPHPSNIPEVLKIRMLGNYYDSLLTTPFYNGKERAKYHLVKNEKLKYTDEDINRKGINVIPENFSNNDFSVYASVAGFASIYKDNEGKNGIAINGKCTYGDFLLFMPGLKEVKVKDKSYVRPGDLIAVAGKNKYSDTPNLRMELKINDKYDTPLVHFGLGQQFLTYITADKSLWDAREIKDFVAQIKDVPLDRKDANGEEIFIQPTGSHLVFYEIMEIIKSEGTFMFGIVLIVIFLILWIDFRSFRFAFIALSPLLLGIIWMFGVMAFLDVKLTYLNIIVLPLLLGTGINNGIFISHRFRRCQSVRLTMATTGKAQLICAVNMMVGWGTLIVCSFVGLQTMAHLLLIGYACMIVLFWTVMPALMQLVQGKKFAIDPEFREKSKLMMDIKINRSIQ